MHPGSNCKYELFFDLSPDCLCIAGFDGYFKKVNPAVSKLLGYTMEELYARPINEFVYCEDQQLTSVVRAELTKRRPLYNFENRYVKKNGDIVWLSWTSLPVEADHLIFAVAKDITHKKLLEAERNVLLTSLTKVNNDLKKLNYTASHDLRSPVNNLLAVFNMIDISRINDAETVQLIEILRSAGENLKQTLNNYVDVLTGKDNCHIRVEDVDLQDSLNVVLNSITSLVESSKATFHISFSHAEKIKFNKAYLESVFLNLITNAIKYGRPDCHPVISIYTERVNETVQLIVADNGLGFDMKTVKDKIFGLHQKFHNHIDSKGIGLYLVHSHVTNLGGQIRVESEINRGTKFTISFSD